jgi:Fe2+ or Zn2+ uptake regulation protein
MKAPSDFQLQADLRRPGRRVTNQRRRILEVVRGTDSHPTAEWVYQKVRRRLPRISLGTVYRNLKLLTEEGLIQELDDRGFGRYDGNTGRHDHFTCQRCGRIFDLEARLDPSLGRRIRARTGFAITHHRIEFYGLCSSCVVAAGRAKGGEANKRARHRP